VSVAPLSTRVNLAPYSYFNAVADTPPMVIFSNSGSKAGETAAKDSVTNIRATGEFVCNVVPLALKDAMNLSSGEYHAEIDEFEHAGLAKAPSRVVTPPRVAAAPAVLECRLWRIVELPGAANVLVIGEVVGVHIADSVIVDGKVDVTLYQPLARLGYRDYAAVSAVFALARPGQR
jgi:flavin reductase (DIM6/NTAB) family NADH-FMN oxidoreductase RutF